MNLLERIEGASCVEELLQKKEDVPPFGSVLFVEPPYEVAEALGKKIEWLKDQKGRVLTDKDEETGKTTMIPDVDRIKMSEIMVATIAATLCDPDSTDLVFKNEEHCKDIILASL